MAGGRRRFLAGVVVDVGQDDLRALAREELGARGLAAASSLAILAYTVVLAALLARSSRPASAASWWDWLMRTAAALVGALLLGWSLQRVVPLAGDATAMVLLRGAVHGGAACVAFLGFAALLGLREAFGLVPRRSRLSEERGRA